MKCPRHQRNCEMPHRCSLLLHAAQVPNTTEAADSTSINQQTTKLLLSTWPAGSRSGNISRSSLFLLTPLSLFSGSLLRFLHLKTCKDTTSDV